MLFGNMDINILKKKKVMSLCYQEILEIHYIWKLYIYIYIYESALKYTKMAGQSNYLKTSLSKIIIKQNVNFIYIFQIKTLI